MAKTKQRKPVVAGHEFHRLGDWEVSLRIGDSLILHDVWPDGGSAAGVFAFADDTGTVVFRAPMVNVLYTSRIPVPDSDGAATEKLVPLPEGVGITPEQLAEFQEAILAAGPARIRLLPPRAEVLPAEEACGAHVSVPGV